MIISVISGLLFILSPKESLRNLCMIMSVKREHCSVTVLMQNKKIRMEKFEENQLFLLEKFFFYCDLCLIMSQQFSVDMPSFKKIKLRESSSDWIFIFYNNFNIEFSLPVINN